jgi:hypothetical protein
LMENERLTLLLKVTAPAPPTVNLTAMTNATAAGAAVAAAPGGA